MLHGAFLDQLRAVSIARVFVYDLDIKPCTACSRCKDEFFCPIKDDMAKLYGLIDECSFISISTPLFFSAPPSPLKSVIDRCQPFWERRRREGMASQEKKSFLVAVGGGEYAQMFDPLRRIMRHFFRSCGFFFDENEWIFVSGTDGRRITDAEIRHASEVGRKFAQSL